ncbi:MAG: non-hydrolyzing UDP-N-acetylglucosamine 2-epimerase [Sciscionella sp.]
MTSDVLLLAGTRPEAVKVAPVALALAAHSELRPVIVHSGQHDGMVEQALAPFGLRHDERLPVLRASGTQAELFSALLPELDEVLLRRAPSAMLVQGDTSTTLAGALAAFWRGIPVIHLEAGLRTGDLRAPFPEEGNRQMVSRIAALHLAPTEAAAAALRAESVPHQRIVVIGNTVVDAVRHIAQAGLAPTDPVVGELAATGGRLLLVTVHRRESWGEGLGRVLDAVRQIVTEHPDVVVLLPAHPNPAVSGQVDAAFDDHPAVRVTGPLDYPDLVWALRRSSLVLTDSGGIQEEAPSFGVPVLVAREVTERREAVDAGYAWLVGTDTSLIVAEARRLLSSRTRLAAEGNPYGDGTAGPRAVEAIENLLAQHPLAATTP